MPREGGLNDRDQAYTSPGGEAIPGASLEWRSVIVMGKV